MDSHISAEEMDLARQMGELNLSWEFGVGDYFCTDNDDDLHICIDIETPAGGAARVADSRHQRFEASGVYWIPKRAQCLTWLGERGWDVRIQESGPSWAARLSNPRESGVSTLEGFGHTELAALYSAICQMLEWKIEGMAL